MTTRTQIIRSTTGDRGPPDGGAVIHTVEQLGPNMSKLANGSLLCRNVPLSRVGWMLYGPNETPIKTNDNGVAYVERTHDTLFSPTCVSSFVGATVVDEHPSNDVTPENWKKLSQGVVLTARQGTGDDADVILGDLLITDAKLIASILSGKREVSAGYDADYEQTGVGLGRQTDIIVNHIALVEKGRCGPRCAIGDRQTVSSTQPEKEMPMATQRVKINAGTKRRAVLDGLRQTAKDALEALETAASEASEEEADPSGGGDTHIHIHGQGDDPGGGDDANTDDDGEGGDQLHPGAVDPIEQRFVAIEGALAAINETLAGLAKPDADTNDDSALTPGDEGDNDDDDSATMDDGEEDTANKEGDGKTMDSKALEAGFNKVMAQAEVLMPGFKMPTFDAKAKRKATVDSMCGSRRKALDMAYMTKDGASLIDGITGTKTLTLDKMGCKDVATLFNAAAGAKAAINNASATRDSVLQKKEVVQVKGIATPAEINAANAAFWAKQLRK